MREAPDIKRRVCMRAKPPTREFARIKIVAYTDYDLIAERG